MFAVTTLYLLVRFFGCLNNRLGFTQTLYDRVIKTNMDEYAGGSFYKVPSSKYTWVQVAMGYNKSSGIR
jgi:hypothetical protein